MTNIINSYRFGGLEFDVDAADYFARIVTAGSTISEANKTAVNAFVVGCKDDGIWSAIKASCILAGADTLAGALVPLVGPAPTNEGPFVEGDYSRTTGLVGDGTSKYLNSNAAHNVAPQNNVHCAVFTTTLRQAGTNFYIGSTSGSVTQIGGDTSTGAKETWVAHDTNSSVPRSGDPVAGFMGVARSSNVNFIRRNNSVSTVVTRSASGTEPGTGTFGVFARNSTLLCSARIRFYSIGESLDLALLDARLETLMGALT